MTLILSMMTSFLASTGHFYQCANGHTFVITEVRDTSFAILLTIYSQVASSVVVPWNEAAAQNAVVLSEGQTITWMLRILVQRSSTDCISNLTIYLFF